MRIIGLDPSLVCIGWALLERDMDLRLEWVSSWGTIRPEGETLDEKLHDAADKVGRLFDGGGADVLAMELPVVYRNPATTIKLGQLLGVIRYVAYRWTERTIEVMPGGRLSALGLPINLKRPVAKELVRNTVNALYKLHLEPQDHDIADAVAVAHAALVELKKEEWGR